MPISAALGSSALLPAGLGFRNVLINGGFDVWQRTTSSEYAASATAEYKAPDRWWSAQLATTSTLIVGRVTADTSFLQYGCRVQRKSGQTGTGTIYFGQTLESAMSKTFAGRTVTLSFYAKKGANAVSTFDAVVYGGTGTDQTSASLFSTGWTSGANLLSQTVTPTTTMTRYSYTFTVASTYTQIGIWFKWTPSGTAGTDDWFQFEGVQLEANYQPTPFEQRPIGVELALCQRYFQQVPWELETTPIVHNLGIAWTTSAYKWISAYFPVQMRANPTVTTMSGAGAGYDNKVRYLTSTGSGAGVDRSPYGIVGKVWGIQIKSYNEANDITHYGINAGYRADAEL
jgi:hypothetical protein